MYLESTGLPTVPWKIFDENAVMDSNRLWTVRTALIKGNDVSLPRYVGVNGEEAYRKAKEIKEQIGDNSIVFYYPFFIAETSGVIMTTPERKIIIEVCREDLWNLVDKQIVDLRIEASVTEPNFKVTPEGSDLLSVKQMGELISMARRQYQKTRGQYAWAEWSYAYESDLNKKPASERYLVFYQLNSKQC